MNILPNAHHVSAPPRLAFLNPDSIGDLILRQPLFAATEEAGFRIALVVRPAVVPMAARLMPRAEIVPYPNDPYDPVRDPHPFHVAQVVDELRGLDTAMVVAAAYQRTRFDELVCAGLPEVEKVGFAGQRYPANTPPAQDARWIGIMARVVPVDEDEHDWRKNERLARAILGQHVAWKSPHLAAAPRERDEAKRLLADHGVSWPSFHVACVGTSSRLHGRSWPTERWVAVLRHASRRHGWRFVLIGTTDERDANDWIAGEVGVDSAACVGGELEIDSLIGLIASSAGYVGRDSGPMHVAAALGRPVLSVTGGGTWPRFLPLAPTGAMFSLDVPCAGCGWFCHIDERYCMTHLPLEPVMAAVDDLAGRTDDGAGVTAWPLPRPDGLAHHMERVAARAGRSHIWQMHQWATVGVSPRPPHPATPHRGRPRVFLGMHFYGAGNIGDDLALAGFLEAWERLGSPGDLVAAIPFPTASQARRFPAVEWLVDEPSAREAAIRSCDVWLGMGGSPFQSDCGPWMLDHLAREAATCRRLGRPMFFLGAGLNDRQALADPRARAAIQQAEHLWIRDEDCASWTAAVAGEAKVTAAADCAHVFLAGISGPNPERRRLAWVIAIEDESRCAGGAIEETILRLGDRQHDWLVQDIRALPGGERWRYRRLGGEARRTVRLRVPDYDAATAAGLLATWPAAETVVSSRYHALLVAAWRGSRLVPVSRNDKVVAAARGLGCPPPERADDADALWAAIAAGKPADRERLTALADSAFEACRNFVERIGASCPAQPADTDRRVAHTSA